MPNVSNFMSEANKVGTHGSCVRGTEYKGEVKSKELGVRSWEFFE